jgi:hypothetical protein
MFRDKIKEPEIIENPFNTFFITVIGMMNNAAINLITEVATKSQHSV